MRTRIRIEYGDDAVIMSWDGSQASAPIHVDGVPTQYQTADARHRTDLAVALACRSTWPEDRWPDVPALGPIGDLGPFEAWEAMSYGPAGEDAEVTVHDDASPSKYYPEPEQRQNGAMDFSVTIVIGDRVIEGGITLYRDWDGSLGPCGTPMDGWCSPEIAALAYTLTDSSRRALLAALAAGPGTEQIEIDGEAGP